MHLKALALTALLGASLSAQAAPQCLTNGPGTYGAVTVTGCDHDPANGIHNPYTLPGMPHVGFALADFAPMTAACTLNFSHPIQTSSLTLSLDAHQTLDVLSIATQAGPYQPVAADIFDSPLPGAVSPNALLISGSTIIGDGSATVPPFSTGSSGRLRLTNNAPATITSLSFDMDGGDLGSLFGLCFDDAPPSATPVPTLGAWALGGLALLCGMLGMLGMRRRERRA